MCGSLPFLRKVLSVGAGLNLSDILRYRRSQLRRRVTSCGIAQVELENVPMITWHVPTEAAAQCRWPKVHKHASHS
jgi:hypothetical protein